MVELDRATGLLLDHANIDVPEATRGQVTHLPAVPYVAPRQDIKPESTTAPAQSNSSVHQEATAAQPGGQ
jgi:hypothetical protein